MKLNAANLDAMATAIVNCIKAAIDGPRVGGRITALEARIVALEARPDGVKYAGVWRTGQPYAEGQLTTHKGGLWLAESPTTFAPGAAGSGWKLIVKSGDAR